MSFVYLVKVCLDVWGVWLGGVYCSCLEVWLKLRLAFLYMVCLVVLCLLENWCVGKLVCLDRGVFGQGCVWIGVCLAHYELVVGMATLYV